MCRYVCRRTPLLVKPCLGRPWGLQYVLPEQRSTDHLLSHHTTHTGAHKQMSNTFARVSRPGSSRQNKQQGRPLLSTVRPPTYVNTLCPPHPVLLQHHVLRVLEPLPQPFLLLLVHLPCRVNNNIRPSLSVYMDKLHKIALTSPSSHEQPVRGCTHLLPVGG